MLQFLVVLLNMRVAIFGATGMLGKALVRRWRKDEVFGFGSADADVRDPDKVSALIKRTKPDWIVLAAAYTDVDGCELNPILAAAINTHGAVNVANAAAETRARLLFVSTDYVFDGKISFPYETSDARNPINVYGRSKADAEVKIASILPNSCIVRTSWLFGPGGKCFPDTILKAAATRPELEVVNDQRGCPTYTLDLAEAIVQLCRKNATAIVHCTNSGDCTWYEFAYAILKQAGSTTKVRPTTSDKFVCPAERPRYSVLSAASLAACEISMRHWRDTVPEYLRERAAT